MLEFLTNILIQSASAALGFVCGIVYMRDCYINCIIDLRQRIALLESILSTEERSFYESRF